jgi:trimeric autotransporter adhesin
MKTPFVRLAAIAAACLAVAVTFACGSDSTSPSGGGALAKIVLTPESSTVALNTTETITAQPENSSGGKVNGITLFWSSNDTLIAKVSQTGVVTPVATGTVLIAASANGISSAPATVVVGLPTVASITLSPTAVTLRVGGTTKVTATLKNAAGDTLIRPITWTTSNPAISSVDGAGNISAIAVGTDTVTAAAGGQNAICVVTVTNVPVKSLTLGPANPSVIIGQTTQLTATAKDSVGDVLTGRVVTWTSQSTNIATVSPSGVVTGVAQGTDSIIATCEGITAKIVVTVNPVPASTVIISPNSTTILVGGTLQLSATVTDQNGNAISGATVTYTSNNAGVASVTTGGLVTGVAQGGPVTITGTSTANGTTVTGTAQITVTAVPVAQIVVSPATYTLTATGTVQLTATPEDVNGNPLSGRTVTWSSSNNSFATVNANGLVTTIAAGQVTIFAKIGGVVGDAVITINPVPIKSVTVAPATDTVQVAAGRQLSVTVIDSLNRTVSNPTVTWSQSNNVVASVNSSGFVTGLAAGNDTITATSGGVSGFNITTVIPVPVSGVTVTPNPSSVVINGTTTLSAATNPAGNPVTWSSANNGIATVDNNGNVTGVSIGGPIAITATSGSASGSSQLTVTLNNIVVTPNPIAVQVAGATVQATATGQDANGNNVTNFTTFTWRTYSGGTTASVSASGVVTGVAAGTDTVYATGGGRTGKAVVNVSAAAVAKVTVTPTPDTTYATSPNNNTVTLTAAAFDANNNPISGVTFTWASGNTQVATVSAGVVTPAGAAAGSATITATAPNSVAGSATVVALGHTGTVTLTAASANLSATGTVYPTTTTVSAALTDTFGNPLPGTRMVTWTSSDPTNAPITVAGNPVTGPIPASTTVTVTAAGTSNPLGESVTITATSADNSTPGTTTLTLYP